MSAKTTKKTKTEHGKPDTAAKDKLADKEFAFPKKRKEPLSDASHVRNAMPGSTR